MSPKDVINICRKLIETVQRNIRLTIGRCVLETIDDSKGIQVAKVSLLEGEIKEMERIQQYGLTSNPSSGEGVAVFVGGNREHGIIINMDSRQFRLKGLDSGQVALYDEEGSKVLLKNDGEIEIVAATKVVVSSASVEIGDGSLEAVLKGETFQTFFNSHTHTGNLGAPTGPPNSPSIPSHLSTVVKEA